MWRRAIYSVLRIIGIAGANMWSVVPEDSFPAAFNGSARLKAGLTPDRYICLGFDRVADKGKHALRDFVPVRV